MKKISLVIIFILVFWCVSVMADSKSPGQIWTEPVTGMEFVWVPEGCYQMGQTESEKQYLINESGEKKYNKFFDDELPRHRICVDGFWMAKHEVTRGQFRKFIEETGYRTDADKEGKVWMKNKDTKGKWKAMPGYNWEKTGFSQNDLHPVACVSWNDAQNFIKWLNNKTGFTFALPSEAQWEYAARAGTSTIRFWGTNDSDACTYANVADKGSGWRSLFPCNDGYKFTAPVGKFKPNAFGLYDMLGNLWEWCGDVYDSDAYSKHSRKNPLVTSTGNSRVLNQIHPLIAREYKHLETSTVNPRVLRGGSWIHYPVMMRAANRHGYPARHRGVALGFRLSRPLVR